MHSMHNSTPQGILRHLMVVMMDKLEAQDVRAKYRKKDFFTLSILKTPIRFWTLGVISVMYGKFLDGNI